MLLSSQKTNRYYHACWMIFLFTVFTSCELPSRERTNIGSANAYITDTASVANEEYVMITAAVNLPLYVNHEQTAFKNWGKQMGVPVSILGNDEWDVQKIVEIVEQVIQQRPSGLLINGTDPGLATVINKAVDAGIPVVVYDSEIPGSRPNCFVGSDWYTMGYSQGEKVGKLIMGKGKVACLGILGLQNQEDGFRGLQDALKKYPAIEFVGKYNDAANLENAAKVTSDIISANPDIAAICGFTSATGPGIALAVKETGKAGKIIITCVDAEPEHISLIKEGVIQYSVGQKRDLFGSFGGQMLYDVVHKKASFSQNDRAAGVNPIPVHVNTGLIEIDSTNIQYF